MLPDFIKLGNFRCSLIGHYERVKSQKDEKFFVNFTQIPKYLFIGSSDDNGTVVSINLYDSRNNSKERAHRLAVCVPPMSVFADWTITVQFFEVFAIYSVGKIGVTLRLLILIWCQSGSNELIQVATTCILLQTWIAHDATLFFVVLESLTTEVDAMLQIYENSENITVIRIPWSFLPLSANGSQENDDPNNHIFRSEVRWIMAWGAYKRNRKQQKSIDKKFRNVSNKHTSKVRLVSNLD